MAHAYGITLVDLAKTSKPQAALLALRRDKIAPEGFAALGIIERRSAGDIRECATWVRRWGRKHLPQYGSNLLAVLVKHGGEQSKVRYWHYAEHEEA